MCALVGVLPNVHGVTNLAELLREFVRLVRVVAPCGERVAGLVVNDLITCRVENSFRVS